MTRIVTWRGQRFDERTAQMLQAVADNVPFFVQPSQGSYNGGGVAASAGTHDGGGAVDVIVSNLSTAQRQQLVREMRRVGFAAWLRTPAQSNWPYHVHGIAVQPGGKHDRGVLSYGAHRQVIDYYENRNGLASGARDDGPRQWVGVTWEEARDDMPLSDKDIQRIAQAVWRVQVKDDDKGDTTSALNLLRRTSRRSAGAWRVAKDILRKAAG